MQASMTTCAEADRYDIDVRMLDALLGAPPSGPGSIMRVLRHIEDAFGYLPRTALGELSRRHGLPPAAVYGLAALHTRVRRHPQARAVVRVCSGRLCHVTDTEAIVRAVVEELGIAVGEESLDGRVMLRRITCAQCDGLSPVTVLAANSDPGRDRPCEERASGGATGATRRSHRSSDPGHREAARR